MFTFVLRSLKRLAEGAVSFRRKSERSAFVGGPADSVSGIMLDVPHFPRVSEHAAEQAYSAHGGCRPAGHARKAMGLRFHRGGSLAARDTIKQSLHVRVGEVPERFFPEEGNDMAGNPPAIDLERAGLLG